MSQDVLTLPRHLDIAAAARLRESLLALRKGESGVVVDAGAVETITTPCLQILMAAARDAGGLGIRNAASAFRAAVHDLGVAEALPLPPTDEESVSR